MKKLIPLLLCSCFLFLNSAFAGNYTAFSLRTAQSQIRGGVRAHNLSNMGGITHPVALVFDEKTNDVILVGKTEEGFSPVSLDDWAVAIKAILGRKQDPAVSIDCTNDTPISKKQEVRFEGGIENTQFGKDLLAADVVLKRLGLHTLSADVFGVSSYLDLSRSDYEETGRQNPVINRFWFLPDTEHAKVTVQEGLVIAEEYRILVQNEVMSASGDTIRDLPAETFASKLYANFQDIKLYYPVLSRMEQLYYLTALAKGLNTCRMSKSSSITYWLDGFKAKKVYTQREYPVEENTAIATYEGKEVEIVVNGGIDFDVMVYRLKSGGIDDIKKYIINSRPDKHSLFWNVPLLTCVLEENYDSNAIETIIQTEVKKAHFGTSILKSFRSAQTTVNPTAIGMPSFANRPVATQMPSINFSRQLSLSYRSPDVGGVMLENVAEAYGEGKGGPLDMASATFSLVVDGKDARLDPMTFRKFITALWAVYYGNEDPGISIDPIASGAKKHMVRYIGKVINTDLGRVMREADYLMKKWAVGTEKSDIEGFKSPMEYAAESEMLSLGSWSRFWFVPKDMKFKRSENMLFFESGRMTVQTEYMYQGFESGSDLANQHFAEFFTNNYKKIAKAYPIFQELYEYAKMVSLAKYLKESGLPLFWFLMANKHLVLTEDSARTVGALVNNSKLFSGVYVEGGVKMVGKVGDYIPFDKETIKAINDAIAQLPEYKETIKPIIDDIVPLPEYNTKPLSSVSGKSKQIMISRFVTIKMQNKNITILPQHSSSSGKDFRGMRYQTDFAVKESGYQLTQKSLVELQYEIFRLKYAKLLFDASESGGKISDDEAELIFKESLAKAEADSEKIVGNLSDLVGKEFKSEAKFQNALEKYMTKVDLEQWKDLVTHQALYHSSLEMVRCFHLDKKKDHIFGPGWDLMVPYQIKPHGDETVEFRGLILPKEMDLVDRLSGMSEVLRFDADRFNSAAYIPEDVKKSQVVGLFFMTDASFRMLDKIQNEFHFDSGGLLTYMVFSDVHQISFDYQTNFATKLDKPPYKIESASDKWVQFRSIQLPEKLRIVDLSDNSAETVVFTDAKRLIGYESKNPNNDKFEFLTLMADCSYRLLDKKKNELVFDQSGKFEKIIYASEQPLIRSMASGNYTVDFEYTLNTQHKPAIVRASLKKGDNDNEDITLSYQYGMDGYLVKVVPLKAGEAKIAISQ